MDLTLRRFGINGLDAALSLESPISRGKGMASSTADVVASVAASAAALGRASDAELPQVFALADAADAVGAVGVNIAHSGTVVGVLFDADAERVEWAAAQACSQPRDLRAIHRQRLIGGGGEVRCRPLPGEVRC